MSVPPPTANPDSYQTDEDVTLVIAAVSGVLDNDSAVDPPDGLTAVLVAGPSNGTLTAFGSDGGFSYLRTRTSTAWTASPTGPSMAAAAPGPGFGDVDDRRDQRQPGGGG